MTVNLYMTWETPYLPAVAGLTVEAWPASDFTHSPVGNPSAYPPAPSPAATTTTDSSGNCELTGLTAGTDYYISIIDQNNQPWFQPCPAAYLGNLSTSRRRWSINQGPVATVSNALTEITSGTLEVNNPEGPSVDIEVGPQPEHRPWPTPWGGSGGPGAGTAYRNTLGVNAYITLLVSLNFPGGGPTAGTQHTYAVFVGTTSGSSNLFQLESLEYETGFESPAQPTLRGVQFIVPPDAYFEVSIDTLTTIAGYEVIY